MAHQNAATRPGHLGVGLQQGLVRMFLWKCPLDIWVPSAGSILFSIIVLPGSAALAYSLSLSHGFQGLATTLGISLASLAHSAAARVSARRHGTPFVARAEAAVYRNAWAAAQPVGRLFLLAILPIWAGWTLFIAQFLAQRPLWMLGPGDWIPAAAGSLFFGAMWTVMWLGFQRSAPQPGRRLDTYQARFLRL